MRYGTKQRLAALALTALLAFGTVQAQEPVSERDDFYLAVNGPTLAEKKIEPTEPSWSWFKEQSLKNTKILEQELHEIAAKEGSYAKGTPEQKIADLYRCAVDMERRDATARQHLQDVLAPVRQAGTTDELTQALLQVREVSGASVFVDYTADRMPDSLRYAARIVPAGTILSKYELEKEPQPGAWQAYKKYIADVLTEAGCPEEEAVRQAEAIFAMEQSWAPVMLSSEERNDFAVLNTMYTRKEIEAFLPHMDGRRLLSSWKLTKEKKLFLADAAYLQKLDEAYVQDNLPLLKSYAVFRIMDGFAPYADSQLRDLQRSYTQYRFGIEKSRSDEETASRMVQALLPYEFGQIYMKDHCSPDAVRDVTAMIDKIRGVYRERLLKNDWLGEDTKKEAIGKLDALRVFVGGPAADDKPIIEDMPDVVSEEDGGDLLSNIMHNAVLVQDQVHQLIGTDFDPDKWYAFQPQDVNAAYIPANNSITIPAGILNLPFYSPDASYGANLGGIGVVIGHEISHAFDPNGSQYDKDGNMKNWWTAGDYAMFQQKAAAFAPYYSRYEVGEGLYENGALVANEAIADCGGLSVATEIAGGDENTLRDLYRSFAAIFASKMTPQLLLQSVQTDPHPIMQARVNGALSATDSFYEAYDVEDGDGMYVAPEQRVKLW
ncbi:M13 family metallopeptidase [uncultured Megasphaera sp.]|uniref:M13 family metallopeptidase n=1 Tax=uncultured Megasphaera sp. TaxID=165188 RepID=UPI0026032721|nr:M13 family metallopeptidase [uncultured Megasphaera sp.]